MASVKGLQLNMSFETGAPVTRFTVEYSTGDKASGIADQAFVMQMVNQFYPAGVATYALGVATAAAAAATTAPSTTTTTSSTSAVVTTPVATLKVGL